MANVSDLTRDIRQGRSSRYIRRVYGDLLTDFGVEITKNHSWKERFENISNIESAICSRSRNSNDMCLSYFQDFSDQLGKIDYKLISRSKYANDVYDNLEGMSIRVRDTISKLNFASSRLEQGISEMDHLTHVCNVNSSPVRILERPLEVMVYDDEVITEIKPLAIVERPYFVPNSSPKSKSYLGRIFALGAILSIPFFGTTCQINRAPLDVSNYSEIKY